jgi:fructose-1,6-bisphosphatase
MASTSCQAPAGAGSSVPEAVISLIADSSRDTGLVTLLDHLLSSVRAIAGCLRYGEASHDAIGTQNAFGDNQLHVDVVTDEGKICFLVKLSYVMSFLFSDASDSDHELPKKQRFSACRLLGGNSY